MNASPYCEWCPFPGCDSCAYKGHERHLPPAPTGLTFTAYGIVAGQGIPGGLPDHIKRHIKVDAAGCWLWTASMSRDGYGWSSMKRKTYQAHRLVYRLLVGEPPAGLVIDHLCRVRRCVNPDHMEPVTPRENIARGNTPTGWDRCQKCGDEFGRVGNQRRCLACRDEYELGRRESKRMAERVRRSVARSSS